jgi:hypothetical protein
MRSLLAQDVVANVFQWGIYRIFQRWWLPEVVRFYQGEFTRGLDLRVKVLLEHVDQCIGKFGNSTVLI